MHFKDALPMATHPTSPCSTPPADVEWRLTRHPRNVGRARRLLRDQAGRWLLADDVTETAVLLVSELVTNACRHTRVPADRYTAVRCLLRGGSIRVEVSDADPELPRQRLASTDDECGRGLALVEALAKDWGAHPRPSGIGKTVWFELACP
ncbi:ATP-binding protein [Kitasatospora mediocidica]|uniref:ATP-binding protein n=1 Tax=Kitasatospora mediocidica TaxID=58352 RepID=UPI001E50C9A9|nr:ATP-binding protein [Kitasatospora mediocidica]